MQMASEEIAGFQDRWARRIARDALARRVIATLWRQRDDYVDPVLEQARVDNPIIDPVIRSEPIEMARHVGDHFKALLTLPAPTWAAADPLGFVAEHGARRARAGVPLRAVLQAYRSGHKSFWAIMCGQIDRLARSPQAGMRATMLLSDYCIEYTDLISVVVTDAYTAEEARIAGDRTRLSIAVIEQLLRGESPSHEPGRRLCERAGIVDGGPLAVVVARPAGDAPDGGAWSRADVALAIERALRTAMPGCLIESRLDDVVAIVRAGATAPGAGDGGSSGEQAARALRAAGVLPQRPPGAWRVGIGLDVDSIAELPRSHAEARLAIDLLGAGQPVAHLARLGVDAYLRHLADATARRLSPPLPAEVRSPPLAATLQAFAASSLNVKACARELGVHTNTIYHRLNRIAQLTGLDPREFAALSQLLTALAIGESAARQR